MNMDVAVFHSGQMFLDSVSVTRPDCVLLDLHMPGLSGADVLRALADAQSDLPIVVITGRDEPASRAGSLALGASAYLTKPIAHAELAQAISESIAGRAAQTRKT
jgi:FixJ family two-component response regulator